MLRVLILGGSGMLGHKLWQVLSPQFNALVTFRQSPTLYTGLGIFDAARTLGHVSAQDFDSIVGALTASRPDVVVNCIGIVKQGAAAKDPYQSISVNALFPHGLAQACGAAGARLIHISTDCVFSGQRGNYTEEDTADASDLYGRTKVLGEVDAEHCLTIRTSMIGRELQGTHGLIEWFLSQQGQTVRGFKRAIFSGFTTAALANIIGDIIASQPDLRGVWHVSAEPINKFDLLMLVKQIMNLNIEIVEEEDLVCDRSLDSSRFCNSTGFVPPTWPAMIDQLARDPTPYEEIRRKGC